MKKLFTLFYLVAMAMPIFAQTEEDETIGTYADRSYSLRMGPTVGATFTKFTQPDEGKLFDGKGAGFAGGLALKMRFGRMSPESNGGTGVLGFGLEVKYAQHSAKTFGVDEKGTENAKFKMSYVEVPVFVDLYPFYKLPSLNTFYVQVGMQYAGTLGVKPETLTLNNPNPDIAYVKYRLDDNGAKLKGQDVRALVGIGYNVPNTGLDINARYYSGFSDLAGNFKSRMRYFEVSLAYLFNL